jgi:hypothetical protein
MAGGISARLSRAEARKFGLVVGAAFLVIGAILSLRGRPLPGQICGGVGGTLILTGLIAPLALRPVYRAWMEMALVISRVTTPIILGIMYFGVIMPIGLVRRMLGHNSMRRQPTADGSWVIREKGQSDLTHQF